MSVSSAHDTSLLSEAELLESDEISLHSEVQISRDSSDFLSINEYLTAHQSLNYLASLTECNALNNDINPALLEKYSNQDMDHFHGMSESDHSNTLITQSESEFNAQPNSSDVDMFCDESATFSADAAQKQLLTNYLINNISDILNISDHESAPIYSGADNQNRCGIEQADASKRFTITGQADKLSAQ
ncbi:hypothetical protein LOZ20_000670 [Ophidiomyces ophidiicola]|nr:hypothetical protein LOZ47_001234 [Ophidiomyces ophidiicola]KAI2141195.1 hypothetical protein LOZ29_001800 [Ophidiomyces ophidiicola]KAI2203518.1 hypothetical protein LOZ20_000670 [Ophidiomyces ophidiicola]KAI2301801.1 hypothetical protein LOZ06_004542 [Ophidiomyces ophidiicola]